MNDTVKNKKIFHVLFLFITVVVYFVTAYNSHGFYHADEHYQIIEFAGYKLGTHSANDLAWEFKAQIRSSIQPTICFIIIKALNNIQIYDPYLQSFLLRLLTACLALFIIYYFVRQTQNQFVDNKTKIIYWLLSFFLWFIPVISVRFSSETWSGLMFLLGLGIFVNKRHTSSKPYLIGLAFGFSLLFRYQLIFAIASFFCWAIFIKKEKWNYLLKVCSTVALVMVFGFVVDLFFYGEPVLTLWNYFYINIIKGVSNDFGTAPWYFYIVKLLSYPSYFIGIPLVISFIILIIFKPKNIFIWCIIPFFIFHSFIPHKEERFLFPMVYLFPIVLIMAYNQLLLIINNKTIVKSLQFFLALLFIPVNMIGLTAMAQKSAGLGRMEITKYIHENSKNKPFCLIYCTWANPYNPWQSLPEKFYMEKNMAEKQIHNLFELNDSLLIPNEDNYLVLRKSDLENNESVNILRKCNFIMVKQSIPLWIEKLNKLYRGFDNQEIVVLYKYKE